MMHIEGITLKETGAGNGLPMSFPGDSKTAERAVIERPLGGCYA